jgi:hypothetical protein
MEITERGVVPSLFCCQLTYRFYGMMDIRDRNGDSWIRKGCVDAVNGDRVERVCGVAADINNDGQSAILACALELLRRYEGRNSGRKVNAVDKDVDIEDFLEWAALGRLV